MSAAIDFQELKFAVFRFDIQAIQPLWLPDYKGSTFRGAFGTTFRDLVCIDKERSCRSCDKAESCIFIYLFKTRNPGTIEKFIKSRQIPSPFVLEPPESPKNNFVEGDMLSFKLILAGKAIDHFPLFVKTFRDVGLHGGIGKRRRFEMGRFLLQEVISLNNEEKNVYKATERLVKTDFKIMDWSAVLEKSSNCPSEDLKIRFLTPARIRHNGAYLGKVQDFDFSFQLFIESLYRRLYMLTYFHCTETVSKFVTPRTYFTDIVSQDLNWTDWDRYSGPQRMRLKLGGFIGEIMYRGEWAKWGNLIKAGEYLHIGKATTFGLGKYEIC